MWPLVHFAQSVFLDQQIPDWSLLIYPAAVATVVLLLGLYAFRALSADLVDEL
jgi:ABC-type polysaccharide/polyol phosphate export permease